MHHVSRAFNDGRTSYVCVGGPMHGRELWFREGNTVRVPRSGNTLDISYVDYNLKQMMIRYKDITADITVWVCDSLEDSDAVNLALTAVIANVIMRKL